MFCFAFFTLLLITPTYFTDGCGVGLHKHKITCQFYYSQLRALMLLVCTNISRNNNVLTACNNCFASAIPANQNTPSMTQMFLCANRYLSRTIYMNCVQILGNDTINMSGVQNVGCQIGFCSFIRCVRKVNSNLLISNCYRRVASTNNAATDMLRVQLYMDVTSCILAMARCNSINPITGQPQNNRFSITTKSCIGPSTKVTRLANTLQITASGDLQVIAFPASSTVSGNQVCSSNTLATQSGFVDVFCS